ncbi:cysteine hydrolase family protein [Nocardioides daejeonensis]|uniref:cysteine hydrolase family protein n=1 Tax=Nocardioides daejeonensis TaxID=1046556 RepID=UPI0013A52D4C|nr:isochorismatase family cysteine hydrolase [Nocardioides daejeonensis]
MSLLRPVLPGDLPPERLALLVIDLQVAYLCDGPLADRRDDLVAGANELAAWCRRRGSPVVSVRTEHRRDGSTWTLNMREDDEGFAFAGDADAQLLPELELVGAHELVKTRDSAFVRTGLDHWLTDAGVEAVLLCGVSTHTCVAATAADAYARDLDVFPVVDAIASHRPAWHGPALELLRQEYRLQTPTWGSVVAAGVRR